jgi:hypothetical protein
LGTGRPRSGDCGVRHLLDEADDAYLLPGRTRPDS